MTRLYLDPEFRGDNERGRRFYERLGFTLIEETTTRVGSQTVHDVWHRLDH